MIKQIFICDKCGKEVSEDRYQVNGLDFCDIHKNELIDMIQAWIDSPEEAEPEPAKKEKKPNKTAEKNKGKKYNTKRTTVIKERHGIRPVRQTTSIDWDKCCALREAGWTYAQIAEECRVNIGTLNTSMCHKMKEYTERKANEKPGKTYYERNYGGNSEDWGKGGREYGEDSGMDQRTGEEAETCVDK